MLRTDITDTELSTTVTALLYKLHLPASADILICSPDRLPPSFTDEAIVLCENEEAAGACSKNARVLMLPLDFSAFAELVCELAFKPPRDTVKVIKEAPSFSFDSETGVITKGSLSVKLSAKEAALFAYLLAAGSRGVSREELRRALWKDTEGTNAPDVYASYLRRKLRPLFGNAVLGNERGVGYILKNLT